MRQARIHPRTLGFLGRALSLEYSAVQQYMTQAALADAWGLADAAARFRHETVEEMRHAERIIQRMLELGVAPNASQLLPAAAARGLADLLLRDAELERDIIALYEDAARFCERIGERDNAAFFEGLLQDELRHAAEIQTWLESLGVLATALEDERATF